MKFHGLLCIFQKSPQQVSSFCFKKEPEYASENFKLLRAKKNFFLIHPHCVSTCVQIKPMLIFFFPLKNDTSLYTIFWEYFWLALHIGSREEVGEAIFFLCSSEGRNISLETKKFRACTNISFRSVQFLRDNTD